ncbi:MAG: hypothetical protein WAM14_22955 [Candidatus Nitrosopolaris sp.]
MPKTEQVIFLILSWSMRGMYYQFVREQHHLEFTCKGSKVKRIEYTDASVLIKNLEDYNLKAHHYPIRINQFGSAIR